MTFLRSRTRWFVFCLVLLTAVPARGAGVLDHLPEDAYGFIQVHNLSEFSRQIQELLAKFSPSPIDPLTLIRISTGLEAGIDLEADLVIAVLPGKTESDEPMPLVLLPMSDYAAFAVSISGDPSGEICRVTIAGQDVLVARDEQFALLMNVENRETMNLLLELEPTPVASLEPLAAWLETTDVAAVLMPTGVEALAKLATVQLELQLAQFEALENNVELPEDQFRRMQMQTKHSVEMLAHWLEFCEAEVGHFGVGLDVDEAGNVRFGERLLAKPGGLLASLPAVEPDPNSPLLGYADQAFVVAGGGPLPSAWGATLARFSRQMMQTMQSEYGLDHLAPKRWDELETVYRNAMNGFHSISLIALPGKKGDPLYGNLFGIMQLDDAPGYLSRLKEFSQLWNEMMLQSTSDLAMPSEVNQIEVDGKPACEMITDVATVARDPNVPILNWVLEAMFGEDGKLKQTIVAADGKTLVYGMSGADQLKPVIKQALAHDAGLSQRADVQTTCKLLSPQACWVMVVSPPGCVAWADRLINEMLSHLAGQTQEIPAMDECPPLGFTLGIVERRWEFNLVCPTETIDAIALYVDKCKALAGQD